MNIELQDGIIGIVTIGSWVAIFVKVRHQTISNQNDIDNLTNRLNAKAKELNDLDNKFLTKNDYEIMTKSITDKIRIAEKSHSTFVTRRELDLTLQNINTKLDLIIKKESE